VLDNVTGSDADDRSMVKFNVDGSGSIVFAADYDDKALAIYQSSDGVGTLVIGSDYAGAAKRFNSMLAYSKTTANFGAVYDATNAVKLGVFQGTGDNTYGKAVIEATFQASTPDSAKVTCYSADASNYIEMDIYDDGTQHVIKFSGPSAAIYPTADKTLDLGLAATAWDDAYADDWNNVADFYHMDDRDDLAELEKIKGSGRIDPRTGLELIDDDTLPEWMLTKDKHTGAVLRDLEGKPYLSNRLVLSLLMGAVRQINRKIEGAK
jgi:hypothetical protein